MIHCWALIRESTPDVDLDADTQRCRTADRGSLGFPSDLTDAEWAQVEPLIPPAKHGGWKRSINIRALEWMPVEGAAQGSAAEQQRQSRECLAFCDRQVDVICYRPG